MKMAAIAFYFMHMQLQKNKITIANDGFIMLPENTWKGAGVSIPVLV